MNHHTTSQYTERVDNKTAERGPAATRVSTGREKERLTNSTVLFNAWLILCHEAVRNIYPIREHQNPIHSLYVMTTTALNKAQMTFPGMGRQKLYCVQFLSLVYSKGKMSFPEN
jgi:hypothetical protein